MTSSNNAAFINFKNRIKYLLGSLFGKRMSFILYTDIWHTKYILKFNIILLLLLLIYIPEGP